MLINKHDCFNVLFELQSKGVNVQEDISKLIKTNHNPTCVMKYLKENNYPTIEFYLSLNKKAHKVIKEILNCQNKPVCNYIKIATSLITQATIKIEHMSQDDIVAQNLIIENLHLKELSHGLNTYFMSGDFSELVNTVMEIRDDVKSILDN